MLEVPRRWEWETRETPLPVPLRSAFPIEESKIPVRDWIVPGLLLRKNLSVLVAPPASGKIAADAAAGDRDCLGRAVGRLVSAAAGKGAGNQCRGRPRRDVPAIVRRGQGYGGRPGGIGGSGLPGRRAGNHRHCQNGLSDQERHSDAVG